MSRAAAARRRRPGVPALLGAFLTVAGFVLFAFFLLLPDRTVTGQLADGDVREWEGAGGYVLTIGAEPGLAYSMLEGRWSPGAVTLQVAGRTIPTQVSAIREVIGVDGAAVHRSASRTDHRVYLWLEDGPPPGTLAVRYTLLLLPRAELVFAGLAALSLGLVLLLHGRGAGTRATLAAHTGVALVFAAILVASQPTVSELRGDARQNLSVALTLADRGLYRDTSTVDSRRETYPYFRREPVYPFLFAAVAGLRGDTAGIAECAASADLPEPCRAPIATILNITGAVFFVVALVSVGQVVVLTTGSQLAAMAALNATGLSIGFQDNALNGLTEVPMAAMMALSAWFTALAWRDLRARYLALAGLAAGLAALTKVVFAPYIAVLLAILALAFAASRRIGVVPAFRALVLCALGFALPVAGWATRNHVAAGEFALVDNRSIGVLHVRASYNAMSWPEYWMGYLYYTPHIRDTLPQRDIDPALYARFDTGNPEGFRRAAQEHYRTRLIEVSSDTFDPVNSPDVPTKLDFSDEQIAQVTAEARAEILAHPRLHLRTVPLLAYRGTFIEQGFGFADRANAPLRYGALEGASLRLRGLSETWVNIAGAAALLLAPILGALAWRSWLPFLVCLPALYLHGIYALVSHFIPRYALPELPLRYAALAILIAALVTLAARPFVRPAR
ncbi:MAG: glycosyltransferase family 39 protein [Roseicyclus sp.]